MYVIRVYIYCLLQVFKGHTQAVNDLAVDPGAEYLFTAGGDGTVRQWILGTGECKRILTGHQGPVVSLIVSTLLLLYLLFNFLLSESFVFSINYISTYVQ